ncbi:MAG TPA: hypothetical protein VFX97_17940 [Pyrinomonadaceae bacterium]|nr:hypothetical protein [Pyrinomonadaceae bacterium]
MGAQTDTIAISDPVAISVAITNPDTVADSVAIANSDTVAISVAIPIAKRLHNQRASDVAGGASGRHHNFARRLNR